MFDEADSLFGKRTEVKSSTATPIHDDPQLEREADVLGAQPARGEPLHFAPGRFDPGSPAGGVVIGHELAHLV